MVTASPYHPDGAVDGVLDGADRERRTGDDVGDPGVDRLVKLLGRHDLVDETPFGGGFGINIVPREQHAHGPLPCNRARKAMSAAGPGQLAEPDLRKSEARMVGRDHDVAGENNFEPPAKCGAVRRADDRLEQVMAAGKAAEATGPLVLGKLFPARTRLHVVPCAESLVALPGNNRDPCVVILSERVKGLTQFDISKII